MSARAAPVKRKPQGFPAEVRGFQVRSLCCGADGGNVTIDADDTASFHCASCDADVDAGVARAVLAQRQALLAWALTAPAIPEGE
jgi:hypothetical protein